jgi:hypothetical protein
MDNHGNTLFYICRFKRTTQLIFAEILCKKLFFCMLNKFYIAARKWIFKWGFDAMSLGEIDIFTLNRLFYLNFMSKKSTSYSVFLRKSIELSFWICRYKIMCCRDYPRKNQVKPNISPNNKQKITFILLQ